MASRLLKGNFNLDRIMSLGASEPKQQQNSINNGLKTGLAIAKSAQQAEKYNKEHAAPKVDPSARMSHSPTGINPNAAVAMPFNAPISAVRTPPPEPMEPMRPDLASRNAAFMAPPPKLALAGALPDEMWNQEEPNTLFHKSDSKDKREAYLLGRAEQSSFDQGFPPDGGFQHDFKKGEDIKAPKKEEKKPEVQASIAAASPVTSQSYTEWMRPPVDWTQYSHQQPVTTQPAPAPKPEAPWYNGPAVKDLAHKSGWLNIGAAGLNPAAAIWQAATAVGEDIGDDRKKAAQATQGSDERIKKKVVGPLYSSPGDTKKNIVPVGFNTENQREAGPAAESTPVSAPFDPLKQTSAPINATSNANTTAKQDYIAGMLDQQGPDQRNTEQLKQDRADAEIARQNAERDRQDLEARKQREADEQRRRYQEQMNKPRYVPPAPVVVNRGNNPPPPPEQTRSQYGTAEPSTGQQVVGTFNDLLKKKYLGTLPAGYNPVPEPVAVQNLANPRTPSRAAFTMMSDERVKEKVSGRGNELKEFLHALNAYSYDYKNPEAPGQSHGRKVGIMAQDLEKSAIGKQAVIETRSGKMVDFGKLIPPTLAAVVVEHKNNAQQDFRIQELEDIVRRLTKKKIKE